MNDPKLVKAVKVLTAALREDEAYWYGWKANIAMCFQDEWNRSAEDRDLHSIANQAAENFLEMLTWEPEEKT